MADNVKCAECGYLAVRHRATRQLLDAELQLRADGYLLDHDPVTGQVAYDSTPICFAQKIDFRKGHGSASHQDQLKDAMQELRDCDGFTEWKQGFTPKDHWEIIQDAERIKWQTRREEEQRDFQALQARLADERHRESQRDNWWRLVATAIVSLAVGVSVACFTFWLGRTSVPGSALSSPQTSSQTTKAR